jgi:hypothetical protein
MPTKELVMNVLLNIDLLAGCCRCRWGWPLLEETVTAYADIIDMHA